MSLTFHARIRTTVGAAILSASILLSAIFTTAIPTYADTPLVAGGKALIVNTDGDNLRIRSGAGTENAQVAEAHEGEVVNILAGPEYDTKNYRWFKVKAPGGTGWIVAGYLQGEATSSSSSSSSSSSASSSSSSQSSSKQSSSSSAPAQSAPKIIGYAKVANTDGDPLRMRTTADRSGDIIILIDADTVLPVKKGPVTDSEGIVWYQVSHAGNTGWVMAQYLVQSLAPVSTEARTAPAAPSAAPAAPVQKAVPAPAAPPVAPAPPAPIQKVAPTDTPVPPKPTPVPPTATPVPPTPVPPTPVPPTPVPPTPTAAPTADVRSGQSRGAQPPAQVSSGSGNTIVSVALRYVGYRYIFGGTTPRGFDCSGFVYYVVNHSGLSIARDMYSQIASGPRVSSKNLQPGDLLFFSNTYKGGLSHAGIYIGNGRFVHAENESTGVAISDLWSAYWGAHYTAAVRVAR